MTIQLHSDRQSEASQDESENLVAVRRNVVLGGIIGAVSFLLGLAFLARGSAIEVLLGLVLLAIAALNLPAVASARTPVLVADNYGIRLRVGWGWRGLPWTAIRQLVVEDQATLLREGRLVIVPRDRSAVLRRLGSVAEWHLRWNKYWYGASLSVPLGLTTILDTDDLAADLRDLAAGRVEVVHVRADEKSWTDAAPLAEAAQDEGSPAVAYPEDYAAHGQPIPEEDGDPQVSTSRVPAEEAPAPAETFSPVLALREIHQPARVDVRLEPPVIEADTEPEVAPELAVERRVPKQGGSQEALAAEELPVDIVIDDLEVVHPVADPVIGTKVSHARECLDMSIEELSQRTRIRPHVLEAIEQDDFGPCGGDFYARGHLTAVSRALGLSLEPLLELYDEHYAQAPINARRVFEAEMSTGLSGGMRATLSGPRWSLLVGAVLSLTMVWGLARIFAGDVEQLTVAPPPEQSAELAGNQTPINSPKMRTTAMSVYAAYAGTHVVVKDRTGKVLWSGDLALGKTRKIIGLAPFNVAADNAGAVLISVKGQQLGDLGTAGAPGSKDFG